MKEKRKILCVCVLIKSIPLRHFITGSTQVTSTQARCEPNSQRANKNDFSETDTPVMLESSSVWFFSSTYQASYRINNQKQLPISKAWETSHLSLPIQSNSCKYKTASQPDVLQVAHIPTNRGHRVCVTFTNGLSCFGGDVWSLAIILIHRTELYLHWRLQGDVDEHLSVYTHTRLL